MVGHQFRVEQTLRFKGVLLYYSVAKTVYRKNRKMIKIDKNLLNDTIGQGRIFVFFYQRIDENVGAWTVWKSRFGL